MARAFGTIALFALAALVLAWHVVWLPPTRVPALFAVMLHLAPVLPGLLLQLTGRRSALFWASVGALPLFCHGVMEAWASPQARVAGLLEAAMALVVIFGASWNGMHQRFARRRDV